MFIIVLPAFTAVKSALVSAMPYVLPVAVSLPTSAGEMPGPLPLVSPCLSSLTLCARHDENYLTRKTRNTIITTTHTSTPHLVIVSLLSSMGIDERISANRILLVVIAQIELPLSFSAK